MAHPNWGGEGRKGGGEGWGEWDTLLALTTMAQPMWEGGKEWEWREGGGVVMHCHPGKRGSRAHIQIIP